MGIEKQRMEDGYCSSEGMIVCASCFDDYAIKDLIKFHGKSKECSYCDRDNIIACSLDIVVAHIVESIESEWDDPANAGVGWEGGWMGASIVSTYELLTGELELEINNDNLLSDINSAILNTDWCKKSPYSLDEHLRLIFSWDAFSDYTKYNSRYFLFKSTNRKFYSNDEIKPEEILESLGNFINDHNLTKNIDTCVDIFRVRIVDINTFFDTAKDIGSPPKEYCTLANRMSPAGISMFYGAFDLDTSILETYEPERKITKKAIYGVFNPVRPLFLIDLSKISSVPSLFDEDGRYFRDSLRFLNNFVDDFCKPIEREDRAHVDYVPTQIVTEYFRHILILDEKIDGIIYPSSKNSESNCIVIFANSDQCVESDGLDINEQILKLNMVSEKNFTV